MAARLSAAAAAMGSRWASGSIVGDWGIRQDRGTMGWVGDVLGGRLSFLKKQNVKKEKPSMLMRFYGIQCCDRPILGYGAYANK